MSDIIADINKRIAEAENARDAAIAELQNLKETIAKNRIVLYEGKAYMFVGTGEYSGFYCPRCSFVEFTSIDSYGCGIHRDSCKCADAGGYYHPLSEIVGNFRSEAKRDDKIAKLAYGLERAKEGFVKISQMALKYAKEGTEA